MEMDPFHIIFWFSKKFSLDLEYKKLWNPIWNVRSFKIEKRIVAVVRLYDVATEQTFSALSGKLDQANSANLKINEYDSYFFWLLSLNIFEKKIKQ